MFVASRCIRACSPTKIADNVLFVSARRSRQHRRPLACNVGFVKACSNKHNLICIMYVIIDGCWFKQHLSLPLRVQEAPCVKGCGGV